MAKKTAILIISGSSNPAGLSAGSSIVGSGSMGIVNMTVTSFKHQTQFKDQPIVLEVKTSGSTYFSDASPITSISYSDGRNRAAVTTCTFTS